jgi:hypothetical protein
MTIRVHSEYEEALKERESLRRIHEETKPRLFYNLLHHGRRIKSLGWSIHIRRCYLAGILAVYVLEQQDFELADRMREIHKMQVSGVDY